MIDKAEALLDDVTENEFTVKYIAGALFEHLRATLDSKMKLSFDDRMAYAVAATINELHEMRFVHKSWQRHCARRMVEKTLELAAQINDRRTSHTKAVDQLNRVVVQRDLEHQKRKEAKDRRSNGRSSLTASEKPVALQGSTPSPKQRPYKRNTNTARRQSKAA